MDINTGIPKLSVTSVVYPVGKIDRTPMMIAMYAPVFLMALNSEGY